MFINLLNSVIEMTIYAISTLYRTIEKKISFNLYELD